MDMYIIEWKGKRMNKIKILVYSIISIFNVLQAGKGHKGGCQQPSQTERTAQSQRDRQLNLNAHLASLQQSSAQSQRDRAQTQTSSQSYYAAQTSEAQKQAAQAQSDYARAHN